MTKRYALIGLATAFSLAAAPTAASARTQATCTLGGDGSVRCAGTIADRTVSPANASGWMQVSGTRAELFLDTWPLVAVFTPDLPVTGELNCSRAAGMAICTGAGDAAGQPILVNTAGSVDGSNALINLADRPTSDPRAQAQAQPTKPRQPGSHHRLDAHGRSSHHHHRSKPHSRKP